MKKKDLALATWIKTTKNRKIFLSVLCVLCVFVVLKSNQALCQTKEVKRSAGSISGRVMLDGKAAPGVIVSIGKIEDSADSDVGPLKKATTDDDGRFRMSGLEAGSYIVTPATPVFVASSKHVSINGENLEDVNFTLSRGGVITGQVTDSDGKPIIGAYLLLHRFDENRRPIGFFHDQVLPETDDRGIYRLYGIPAGSYIVSAEQSREGGRGYERNFYKNSSDSSDNRDQKPSLIEVTAGSEIKDIDIILSRSPRSYEVSGRVIDADSGRPVPNIDCGYGWIGEDGKFDGNFLYGFATNSRGEFRFTSLSPGRYAAFAVSQGTGLYSPPVPFQLTDQDLTGVVIKVLPGSSISGIAVIEGTTDPELLSKITQLELSASIFPREENFPNFFPIKINSDGSFFVSGLRQGRVKLSLEYYYAPKGFSLLRVEHNGAEQPDGIEINAGERVTDVRVVLAYSTGVVRGQVKIEGGTLPDDINLSVTAHRININSDTEQNEQTTQVDTLGRFKFEGLSPGSYEITLNATVQPPGNQIQLPQVKQTVTVANGSETEVNLLLNLNKERGEE